MIQLAIFKILSGDTAGLEDVNRFLRGHRVLEIVKHFDAGSWSFCVSYQLGSFPESRTNPKVDYRDALGPELFEQFSRLRQLRKELAEKENVPVYNVFTNEQLAQMVKMKCVTLADLGKIDGIGSARVERYGSAVLERMKAHA